jgi:hypothetical protein
MGLNVSFTAAASMALNLLQFEDASVALLTQGMKLEDPSDLESDVSVVVHSLHATISRSQRHRHPEKSRRARLLPSR